MQPIDVIRFLIENREVLIGFIVSLVAVVKLTAWGKAQARALDAVVGVIEQVGAGDVKTGVSLVENGLPSGAKDAIRDSVAKVDPKKSEPSLFTRILREVIRGI